MYLYSMSNKYFVVVSLFASLSLKAQVPVRDEPRHHNVFENNYVRLLDVFVSPHEAILKVAIAMRCRRRAI